MCDINKKTKRKSVVVYKVCRKIENKLYAYFSGMEVSVGQVKDLGFFKASKGQYYPFHVRYTFKNQHGVLVHNVHYNENLIGRTSGFELLKIAKIFRYIVGFTTISKEVVIVKLLISGDIMQGTGEGIAKHMDIRSSKVYAGTEILSVKELKIRKK